MIKSNPIPTRWVIHKLENDNTKKKYLTVVKVWNPCQASQPEDPTKGLGIPRESDLEAQWDLITRLP